MTQSSNPSPRCRSIALLLPTVPTGDAPPGEDRHTRCGMWRRASPAAVRILSTATRPSQRGLEMGDLFFLVNKVYFCSE